MSMQGCTSLEPHWDASLGGRTLRAVRSFAIGDTIAEEQPVVRGHCGGVDRCPGCSCVPCSDGCSWSTAQQAGAAISAAIDWHAELCARTPAEPHAGRANWVRVCCLLAVVIQAAASPALWQWLSSHLRPGFDLIDDAAHAVVRSTRAFAREFAERLPPPAGTPRDAWLDELAALLLRLQTNLFYLDESTIGIFALACQLEHACRPNAAVVARGGAAPRLLLRALTPIRAGDAVSFCYLSADNLRDAGSARMELGGAPVGERRARILKELGFFCRCAACAAEERVDPDQQIAHER